MAFTEEPDLTEEGNPEEILHKAVKKEIKEILERKKFEGTLKEYLILDEFGLDLAVFVDFKRDSLIHFFELKAFVGHRQGGVGFGNQRGKGSQVDLLLMNNRKIELADHYIHWILIDGTKKQEDKFVIFDCEKAKRSAMGGVERDKQNNFRVRELMKGSITWDELSKRVSGLLKSSNKS